MKKKPFFLSLCSGLMAALMLVGCSTNELADKVMDNYISPVVKNETISPDSKWINSTIDGSIDENTPVSLKDDFYTAVNKDWLIQPLDKDEKDISRFTDTLRQFRDNMYYIMTADASDVSGLDTNVMSEEKLLHLQQLVYTMVDFGKDADTRNAQGVEPLRPYIEKIAGLSSLDELTDYFCNTDGTNLFSIQLAPFVVDSPVDEELQDGYIVKMQVGAFASMPSKDEYTNLDDKGTYVYGCNQDMMQYVLGQLGYSAKEIDSLLRACYRFEAKLVRCLPEDAEAEDAEYSIKHNNIYSKDGLQELAGNYPLLTILSAYGLDDSNSFTVVEPTQLKEIGKLYTTANLEDMKAYLTVNTVLRASTLLDDTAYEKKVAFSKREGTKKDENEEEQTSTNHPDYKEWYDLYERFVTPYLSDAWQQIYIGHFCSAEEKQEAVELTGQLISAFETCIREADWMGEETRSAALDKLSVMGQHILYPDNMIDYSSLSFDGCNNLVDAVAAINKFNARQDAAKVNQPVDRSEWDMAQIPTTDVNAYYTSGNNSINIAAGLLADHYFFNTDASFEENLASMGSVVGHEITHGFDTQGYQYDKNGRYHSWWTQADRLAFDLRANKLIKYYSGLSPVTRGNYLEGKQVSGEAIADMGGVKCGMVIASKIPDFDYDLYFRTYANIWREHCTYKTAIQLSTDAHPASMLRTNVTLMQFEEFQKTYDIQPGDGMYLAAEDRILVW